MNQDFANHFLALLSCILKNRNIFTYTNQTTYSWLILNSFPSTSLHTFYFSFSCLQTIFFRIFHSLPPSKKIMVRPLVCYSLEYLGAGSRASEKNGPRKSEPARKPYNFEFSAFVHERSLLIGLKWQAITEFIILTSSLIVCGLSQIFRLLAVYRRVFNRFNFWTWLD